MNVGKVVTNVLGGLLLVAIIFVYTSIGTLTNQVHALELKVTKDIGKLTTKFTKEIGHLRNELTEYHAIVGFQQRAIDKLEKRVEKLH